MDILDRISVLLGDREQKELTEYLKLKNSAFSDWKTGKSKSYKKYLIEISEFFGVSIDYLVYGKEKNVSQLTDDEWELVDKFRHLLERDQGRILDRMETIYENYSPEQKENVS